MKRWYTLAMLTLLYVLNYLDRQLVAILAEPMKADLGLTDTQLGFVSGTAFALFYVTVGVPLGQLADRTSRRNIVATCAALWSAMTAACGLAQNFLHLALARIGVGIGEAGCVAPSHAMIGDLFPPARRGLALALFSSGTFLGLLCGLAGGGWVSEAFGWRWAFLGAGVIGVAAALAFALTVAEPARTKHGSVPSTNIKSGLRELWANHVFRWAALGTGLQTLVANGALAWAPAYLVRSHGLGLSEVGVALAVAQGVFGGAGAVLGGWLLDRLALRDARWHLWLPAGAVGLATPLYVASFGATTSGPAIAGLAGATLLAGMTVAPVYALAQVISPPGRRALSVAVLLFVVNFIGIGLGPQVVGLLSDAFAARGAVEPLRIALLVLTTACAAAILCYTIAVRAMAGPLPSDASWLAKSAGK